MPVLCVSCGAMDSEEVARHPALSRLALWQQRLDRFWAARPLAAQTLRAAPPLLALATLAAYFAETRVWAPQLLTLAVVAAVAAERLPLAPRPFNVYNTVTSRRDAYAEAACVGLVGALAVLAGGALLAAAERTGTAVFHREHAWAASPCSFWSAEPLPWLSAGLLAVPLLYFAALAARAKLT
jgi:hypothetical protein